MGKKHFSVRIFSGSKDFTKVFVRWLKKFAIKSVVQSGYYYSTETTGRPANLFRKSSKDNFRLSNIMLSDQEAEFLKLACSDLTYKEIAQNMSITPRMIDSLRDQLFLKLDVKAG